MIDLNRIRITDLQEKKQRGEKIAMLTAYDATMAGLLDRAGVDAILVGDSVGMVMLGYETTLPVTLDAMIHHTAAVMRGVRRALVIADLAVHDLPGRPSKRRCGTPAVCSRKAARPR